MPRGDGTSCNEDFCGDIEQHDARMGPILAALAIGTNPEVYPAGTAKLLRAGSVLTFQIHYTPYGEEGSDQIGIGLVFAKEPPKVQLKMVPFSKQGFTIPPKAPNMSSKPGWSSRRTRQSGASGRTRTCAARAGLRGDRSRRPQRPLLSVPRFDFNWQLVYRLREPMPVRAGSKLHAIGVFDNSANNKNNPDPNAEVKWGNMTTDEMMFASIVYSIGSRSSPTGAR